MKTLMSSIETITSLYEGILSDIDTSLDNSDKAIDKLLYGDFPGYGQQSSEYAYVWHCPALIEKYSSRINAVIGLPYTPIYGIRLTYYVENNQIWPEIQFLSEKWFRNTSSGIRGVRGIIGFTSLAKTRNEKFDKHQNTMDRLYSIMCMFRYNFDAMMNFILDKEVIFLDAIKKHKLYDNHPFIINKYAYGYNDLLHLNSSIKELKGKI